MPGWLLLPPPHTCPPSVRRLVTISQEGAQRRLIKPEEHPVFWDEIPAPAGMLI